MPFYTDNTIEMMMTLNSFGPRFDPQSIPSYDDWVANSSFDPFGPEPFDPTSYTNPGIPLHFHTRGGSHIEEGVGVGSCVYRSHGSSEVNMTRNFPQERSRFAFAQKRIERTTNASVSQIPATHACQSSAARSRTPAPIKATPATVPRVVGPRPLRFPRAFHAGREPALAMPKAVHPLPTWLTHFEDHEEELLAEFCPPSTSTFPVTARVELHSDRVLERPLGMAPLLGFAASDSDYTGTDIEVRDWCPEEDEDSDEGDEDYDLFEFDVDSDFGSDYVSFMSESSTPASYYVVDAFDWPTPYQGQIADGEGYPHASAVTLPDFPPQGSPFLPSSGPRAPPFDPFDLETTQSSNTIPWSAFTDPFTGAPITTSPLQSSVEAGADRFLAEMEEGLGFASRPASESALDSFEGDVEGWYDDRFNLTGYAFPVPPQQPQSLRGAAGFEAPPLYTTTIPLPNTEEREDVEFDAVVILPRSPASWWR